MSLNHWLLKEIKSKMQGVILIGGKGTRLGSITKNYPKPMLEISGKPFVMHLINNIRRFGIDRILLLASHANHVVLDYFKDMKINGCQIEIIIEKEPLGTGGALVNALNHLDDRFYCFNGDSIIDGNWLNLENLVSEDSNIIIGLTEVKDSSRYGTTVLNNNKIIGFQEKKSSDEKNTKNIINGGIYNIKKVVLENYKLQNLSFEENILKDQIDLGKVRGKVINGYFIDIGVKETLSEAKKRNWNIGKKAFLFDRDGTLNEDSGYTHKTNDLIWKPDAIDLIKKLNDLNYFVFVVTNQAGIAKGKFSEFEMHEFHNFMQKELRKSGAHIDKFYFCPFHKDGIIDKYKLDSNDRKPNVGMLDKILEEWDLKKNNLIMIGDRDTDIECANKFGIKSYLYNGKDNLLDCIDIL